MTETAEQFFERHGWTLATDWVPETADSETLREVQFILRNPEICKDGKRHTYQVGPFGLPVWPEAWEHYLRMGEACWENYREENRL